MRQPFFDSNGRHQRHVVRHRHELLDGPNGRHRDRHAQLDAPLAKGLDYFLPVRRGHVMGDARLTRQLADRDY